MVESDFDAAAYAANTSAIIQTQTEIKARLSSSNQLLESTLVESEQQLKSLEKWA